MVVEVSYDLEVEGQIVDRATKNHPLDYIQGTNMLIPKFESSVEGLEPGDIFSFTVTPEEGYGEYDLAKVKELPKESFSIDGKVREDLLTVGRQIPMYNSTGHVEVGTIVAVTEDKVTMDFNHIMAGKTLLFTGEVVSVREATEKELKEGLHGEYLPKEGGCCHGKGGCCHGHHEEGHECKHGEGHECKHGEGHECHCKEDGHECNCNDNK